MSPNVKHAKLVPIASFPPHGPKRVVLCADDFAFTASASKGIASLIAQGRLSAASAMTLSSRWRHDAALLAPWRGRVDVGLHLDWTSPWALAAGHGQSLVALMLQQVAPRWLSASVRQTQNDLQALVHTQLDAFEAAWGAPPDHLDGHQHIQQFEGIRQAVLQVLVNRYAPSERPYIRVSRPVRGLHGFKARVIQALGAKALLQEAEAAQVPVVGWLAGVDDFMGDAASYRQDFVRWLVAVPHGALIMCHPGAPGGEASFPISDGGMEESMDPMDPIDPISMARVREWAYFQSEAFKEDLQRANVVLVRGLDLVRGGLS
jgi:predicted glycoside hydrolase/deacetylase ChbG (UPF0249 family)